MDPNKDKPAEPRPTAETAKTAENSEEAKKTNWIVTMDRVTLCGMGVSIALMLQPWWSGGFKFGFFCTIVFTIGQIVFSHLLPSESS